MMRHNIKFLLPISLCLVVVYFLFMFNVETNSVIRGGSLIFKYSFADKKPKLDYQLINDSVIDGWIQSQLPSLPLEYWNGEQKSKKYPLLYDLEYNNYYWQTFRTSNGTFHLYNAYYDDRVNSPVGPSVRVIAMIDRYVPTVNISCLFWINGQEEPIKVAVESYSVFWHNYWGHHSDVLYGFLITCCLPKNMTKPPNSVSLVELPNAKITNHLSVTYNLPENKSAGKKGFAVCVKGLDFEHEDHSVRMIEWIEMLRLLGVDKIFVYEFIVHPNVTKVLDYYAKTGFIDVRKISLPGSQPNLPGLQHKFQNSRLINKRNNEIIPYNDCLYRNMHRYQYTINMDTDEIIMPINPQDSTWSDLVNRIRENPNWNDVIHSICSRNIHFFDINEAAHTPIRDVPRHLYMLQTVYRQPVHEKETSGTKCFHDTEKILTVHNHLPIKCFNATICKWYLIPTNQSQLQHYRGGCEKFHNCRNFNNSVKDTTILKYKKELVKMSQKVLLDLGFIDDLRDGIEDA